MEKQTRNKQNSLLKNKKQNVYPKHCDKIFKVFVIAQQLRWNFISFQELADVNF